MGLTSEESRFDPWWGQETTYFRNVQTCTGAVPNLVFSGQYGLFLGDEVARVWRWWLAV